MSKTVNVVLFAFLLTTATWAAEDTRQSAVTMDEGVWAAFYDVPSRRFREIRINFVRRQFDQAAWDLQSSATYISIEAERASAEIGKRLNEVADNLQWISNNIDDPSVTGAELDSHFGRAHWLLAQHYLEMARGARDRQQYRNAGLYLWATTHHLERAVLWSNARIDRRVHKTLESLRDLAAQLQEPQLARQAMSEKPLVRADQLLRELGKMVDRPVALSPPAA